QQQQIIIGDNRPAPAQGATRRPYDYSDDLDASRGANHGMTKDKSYDQPAAEGKVAGASAAPSATTASATPAPPPPIPAARPTGGYGNGMPAKTSPSPRRHAVADADEVGGEVQESVAPPTNRLGLGTEFGESRTSSATYTRFVRANNRPIAVAELR